MTETDSEADSRSEKNCQASSFLTLSLTWPQLFIVRAKLISRFWTLNKPMPFPLHHLGQWVSPCCCDHLMSGSVELGTSRTQPLGLYQTRVSSFLELPGNLHFRKLFLLTSWSSCLPWLPCYLCFCSVSWFFFSFKFKLKFQPFVQFFGQQLCKRALFFVASGWAWKRGREAVNYFIKADPCLFILETTLSLLMLDFFLSFKVLLGLLDSVSFQILL